MSEWLQLVVKKMIAFTEQAVKGSSLIKGAKKKKKREKRGQKHSGHILEQLVATVKGKG